MLVPIGGDQIVAVTVHQVEGTSQAQLDLALNRADKPLDCGSLALVTESESVPLTKTQSAPYGTTGEGTHGEVPMGKLKEVAQGKNLKARWCDLEVSFDAAQMTKFREFVQMASTGEAAQ
jgi:hypothetical protein